MTGRCRETASSTATGTRPDREHWSDVAAEWTAWARRPDHDAFWAYRGALREFIGTGRAEALEVGCGEGRVSRELKALGHRVTATDAVAELVDAAAKADSADRYAVADAASLPFGDGSFDLVVAYNVLMDVADVSAAVREIRRVLRPGGGVVLSVVHPFSDRGSFSGSDPDAPFVLHGSYFGRERFEGTEKRAGLRMRFAGWSQPLEDYGAALEQAGLAITGIREPVPERQRAAHDAMEADALVPLAEGAPPPMTEQLIFVLTFASALGCGLNPGVFFAFSAFVMKALGRLPAAQGIAAMQSINVLAVTPLFMAALFGTALLCLALAVIAVVTWGDPRTPWLLAGSALYLGGDIVVTLVRNVPLNNALAAADPSGPEGARLWTRYLGAWTAWNHLRTITGLAALGSFILALV